MYNPSLPFLKILIVIFISFLSLNNLFSQNVAINADGSIPNSSAGLDIKFTNKGLLIPRVAINDVNLALPITAPAEGLLVYNETGSESKGFYFWNGAKWMLLSTGSGSSGWSLTGNAGTVDDGTNFIGTTDNKPLNFKINNEKAGRIGLTGDASTFFGYQAGNSDDKSNNQNVGIGYKALFSNTTGSNNIASGNYALYRNTSGSNNTANGYQSLYSNTTGSDNLANGNQALNANTTGDQNTALGSFALHKNSTGRENTANGFAALHKNSTGNYNTANGYSAGNTITTGSNNTAIGYNAQVPTATGDNQVRIGNIDISYAGVQVAWTITSDRRWKTNIENTPLGLSFINTLRPVVYVRNNDEQKRPEYGFIAQEIEKALQNANVNPEGIISKDDEGMYGVRYNDFIAPMVKSIQELSLENDELKAKNEALEKRLERLENFIK